MPGDEPFVYEDDDRAEVGPFLPEGARSILDAGCGAGGFARTLRRRYGDSAKLTGLEPHTDGAAVALEAGLYDDVVVGPFPEGAEGRSFDCIVFNDVLEHMSDPWQALERAKVHLTAGGHVVASIPSVQYLPVLWDLARHARFDYTETGVLDRTHLRFFTWKTATDMFLHAGYDIVSVTGVNSAFQWKPYRRWRRLERLVGSRRWMQFIVVATPADGSSGRGSSAHAEFNL